MTLRPTSLCRTDRILHPIALVLILSLAHVLFSHDVCGQPSADEFAPLTADVTVLDESSSPMPQMEVRAVSHEYGFRIAATTDSNGQAILKVTPGTWSFYATPVFDRLWNHPGKAYLLVSLAERFDTSSRSIVLTPTASVTVSLVSSIFDFGARENYVGFVVEPYGKFLEARHSGVTLGTTLILHTNPGLTARGYVQSPRSSDEMLYFLQEAKPLASPFQIKITSRNSCTLEFNATSPAGGRTDYHIQLHAHDLTWAWSPFIADFPAGISRLRVSSNQFYMIRAVDAFDARSVRHRIVLNPLTVRPEAGRNAVLNMGGRLRVAGVRTTPRAATGFTPATQIMLHVQDAYDNSVAEVEKMGTGKLTPTVVVRHGSVTSSPFEVYGFFTSKLLEQFERAENPSYEIGWNFGPWGSGSVTGELYGQDERHQTIDETDSLLSQAPRLDTSYRLGQVADYQQFAEAMQRLLGVPVDYKMGVVSNIAHAGFEDEVQHAYKLEIGIELGTPMGWPPGSGYIDHEAGHGRIHKPPCRFSAIRSYGEAYATLVGAKARSAMFGGDEYLKFLLGGHDLFLRHQHGARLNNEHDYIETMQFVTHYINTHYGWTPHRRMITEWENAFRRIRSRLASAGYSDIEQFAIVYSWLCRDNLSSLFEAGGFSVSSARVASGLALAQPYVDGLGGVRLGVGANTVEAPSTSIPIEVIASEPPGVSDIEFALKYDPSKASVSGVYKRDLTDSGSSSLTADVGTPGVVSVHLSGNVPFTGVGTVAQINLSLLPNASGAVEFACTKAHANGIPVPFVNGSLAIPSTPLIGPFPSLPDATEGEPYSTSLWAIGGTPPYRWHVVEDVLPPGLVLNASTGEIHGQASAQGEYLCRVGVGDAKGRESQRWFTVRVLPEIRRTP